MELPTLKSIDPSMSLSRKVVFQSQRNRLGMTGLEDQNLNASLVAHIFHHSTFGLVFRLSFRDNYPTVRGIK